MSINFSRYQQIYGKNFQIPDKPIKQSIRVNTVKISEGELLEKLKAKTVKLEQIHWIKEGFFVETEEFLSKTIEHNLGYFFLQNASSMIPPLILDAKQHETVLDIAASPGAKTTQIAAMMQNTGVIVANDITHDRLKALRGNLQRCGVINTVVTKMWGENFWKTGLQFDKILVDAPCTATGTCKPRVLKQTSMNTIRKLSQIQKRILLSAAKCLKEDGVLVYSTCSLEPEENEEVVDFVLKKIGLTVEEIEIKDLTYISGLTDLDNKKFLEDLSKAIRVIPNENMEGFFVCKLTG